MSPGSDRRPVAAGARVGLLVAVALIGGTLVAAHSGRALAIRDDRASLEHDEVITHLAASGHVDDWQRLVGGGPPRGTWTPAATYAEQLELDDGSSAGEVRANLTDHDLHPPLYFWGVLAAREAGADVADAGVVVNLLAGGATALLLLALLWRSFGDPFAAVVGTSVFVLSPASLLATSLARQYALLTLATAVLLWVTARLADAPKRPWWAAFAAVTAAGLLTAHQFAFPLAGAVVLLALWPRPWTWSRAARAPVAAAIGTAVAVLVHPGVRAQLERGDRHALGYDAGAVRERAWTAIRGLLDVVDLDDRIDRLAVPAAVAAVVLAAAAVRWHRPLRGLARRRPVVAAAAALGAAQLAGYVLTYATGSTPAHAVGRHYVAGFTVPAAVAVATLVSRSRDVRWRAVAVVGTAAVLVVSLQWQAQHHRSSHHRREAVAAVAGASALVADCPSRGHLPGVVMWAEPDARVLLLGRRRVQPPPQGLDPATTFFAHSDPASCPASVGLEADDVLAPLGLRRGELVGWLGEVALYRVVPREPDS